MGKSREGSQSLLKQQIREGKATGGRKQKTGQGRKWMMGRCEGRVQIGCVTRPEEAWR